MIEMDEHSGAYLSICKHYRAILATPSVDKENARMVLQNVVLYLVLSPYDNEQADLAHRIKEDVQLEEIAPYKYVYFMGGDFDGLIGFVGIFWRCS